MIILVQQDSTTSVLTLKVALMIGSQLSSWIPFLLAALYFQYITHKPASPMVFEVFALVVMPINSFLNPVFYSKTYKKVHPAVYAKWRQLRNFLKPTTPPANESNDINPTNTNDQ